MRNTSDYVMEIIGSKENIIKLVSYVKIGNMNRRFIINKGL